MRRDEGLEMELARELDAWLADAYVPASPRNLDAVVERTRTMRQRPAWASLERWLPMAVITARPELVAPLRAAWLVIITLLVMAIVAGGLIVGSRLLSATSLIPQGGAAVLAFSSADGDLYTVRADGTGRHQLTSGPARDLVPVWSPDGTRLAFRSIDGDTVTVAVMDARGGDPTIIHSAAISDTAAGTQSIGVADCWPRAPVWSPDGRLLLFTADGCGEPAELDVAAADGSTPATAFLDQPYLATGPAWANAPGGGSQIAFVGGVADGTKAIHIVDIRSERGLGEGLRFGPRLLAEGPADGDWSVARWSPFTAPSWSPDGTLLAAAAGTNDDCVQPSAGSMDAFVIATGGSEPIPVAATEDKEYNPIWSPDGQRIAFQRIVAPAEWLHGRPCTMAVWIANADGADEHRLEVLGTDDSQPPFWSPDGTRIVGNTVDVIDGVEHYDVYVETIDGSSPAVMIDDGGFATWQPVAARLG